MIGLVRSNLPYAIRKHTKAEYESWAAFTNDIRTTPEQELREVAEYEAQRDKEFQQLKAQVAQVARSQYQFRPNAPQSSPVPESPTKGIRGAMGEFSFQSLQRRREAPDRRQGTPTPRAPSFLTEDQKLKVHELIAQYPIPTTMAEYKASLDSWRAKYGENAAVSLTTPFPPSVGTAPPGSGECYQCGLASRHSWGQTACPNKRIPPRETEWRVICGRIRK